MPGGSRPDTLRIGSGFDEAREARRWLAGRIDAAGFSGEDFAECLLAFGEALSNVVRHAYRGETGRPIEIEVRAHADLVRIVIRDWAPTAFTPQTGRKAPAPEDLAEGGYGLYLIQRLMDELRFVRTPEGANEIHLLKTRTMDRRSA